MANKVNIKIKKVADLKPDERLAWRRDYLSRKTARKSEHNIRVRENISNLRRTLRQVTATGDQAKATETLQKLQSALDKAAKVGVMHKRTASRRKSRLSKSVAALKTA